MTGRAASKEHPMAELPERYMDLITAPGVAILTTNGTGGFPQTSALIYLYEDGALKLSLNETRQKTKNLKLDAKCTLFFIDPANPFRTLEIRAMARLEPDDGKVFAQRVGEKYGIDVRKNDNPGEERVVVTLEPVKVNTYGG
jgi:PPOX class probable F420-dependent enzyme